MKKMKLIGFGLALSLINCEAVLAKTSSVQWLEVGREPGVIIEWASNVVTRETYSVSTLIRMRYSRDDQAPNNRNFNRETIGVDIRCKDKTFVLLGHSYSRGDIEVYSESLGLSQPTAYGNTYVEKIAQRVCET